MRVFAAILVALVMVVYPSSGNYMCRMDLTGKRIDESPAKTPFDCGPNCQGGQCVAYVVCSCKKSNGRGPSSTSSWRPGTKVVINGKCNRNIPLGTAIATFDSSGRYTSGHAAAFRGCGSNESILTYDQYCARAIGDSVYTSSHKNYLKFAVLTATSERQSYQCRTRSPGSGC